MNIVDGGQERYSLSNEGRLRRAQRVLLLEVCRAYQDDLASADFIKRVYLRCKRWLELRQKLNQLQQDLDRNLYLQAADN
jgi:hypothetical protein